MPRHEAIRRAIGAHGLWKTQLRTAIATARAVPSSAIAERDDACEFGGWLHSLPPGEREGPHATEVNELHRIFHHEAARVLKLVEEGRTAEASRAMGSGSPFQDVATRLTMALVDWSKSA
jgi:hypothetical protein